jgi:photosystem II stability/assembly factor-like uncharacterized protein
MRRLSTALVTGLLGIGVLTLSGCSSGSGEGAPGVKKPAVTHEAKGQVQECACPYELRDVFFLSRKTLPLGAPVPENWAEVEGRIGFVIATNSTIMKTADGGNTWRCVAKGQKGSPELNAVLFLGPGEGWAVGLGIALRTGDGGETWAPAPPLPGIVPHLGSCTATATSFLQAKPPTCGATIYRADGGGRAWKPFCEQPRNDYSIIFFLDDLHGWMAGNHGMFAMTADGGKTWTAQDLPGDEDLVMMQFVSPEVGWLKPARSAGVLATSDGGKTWQPKNASLAPMWNVPDMQLLDEKTGFLLVSVETGKMTHVLRTLDGGNQWEIIGRHSVDLVAMSFIDANHGWVVGPNGSVFRYDLGPMASK